MGEGWSEVGVVQDVLPIISKHVPMGCMVSLSSIFSIMTAAASLKGGVHT